MGRWSHFSGVKIDGLQGAVEKTLNDYGESIYWCTESGLTAAEKILIKNLKANTPKKSGAFRKNWKGTGRKYKMCRFVGNATVVYGKDGEEISLANIFEHSTTRGKPFIKRTFEDCVDQMASAVANEIIMGKI